MRGRGGAGLLLGPAGRVPAASAVHWPAARVFFGCAASSFRASLFRASSLYVVGCLATGLRGEACPSGAAARCIQQRARAIPARGLCQGLVSPVGRRVACATRPDRVTFSTPTTAGAGTAGEPEGGGGDTCVACVRARRRRSPRPGRGRVGPRRPTQRSARGGGRAARGDSRRPASNAGAAHAAGVRRDPPKGAQPLVQSMRHSRQAVTVSASQERNNTQ